MIMKKNTIISLRKRSNGKGRIYLYLDFYPPLFFPATGKTKRREYLHMYIHENPSGYVEKEYNKEVMRVAEAIKCERMISMMKEGNGFFDDANEKKDFVEYFREKAENNNEGWMLSFRHFNQYVNGKCRFGDLGPSLYDNFREYLLKEAKVLNPAFKNAYMKQKINHNTAAKVFIMFTRVLKDAYKEGLIREKFFEDLDKINYEKSAHRNYLTMTEIQQLYQTPCRYGVLKQAAMFSIFTGLRYSDISTLDWSEIQEAPDGGPCIIKCFQKTKINSIVYISDEALSFCGTRKTGLVFKDLRRSMLVVPLRDWIQSAGIEKKISFHCFRHTNATMMLAHGVDLYTVSSQLTHVDVKTTQIYTNIVDQKKRHAANAITLKNTQED